MTTIDTNTIKSSAMPIIENINKSGMNIIPLIMIMGIFYIFIIRPQQKQTKQHKNMLSELKVGDKILTSGGIIGIIEIINESDLLCITTASTTQLEITKDTIVKKYTK